MKKIPTVLVRNPENRAKVLEEVTPGCEWVLAGEGVPTRKYDGTCVMLDEAGAWWARREVKRGKTPSNGFRPEQHDETTGKTVGWEPIEQSPFAKFHAEALDMVPDNVMLFPGTCELIGPKINGNPEKAGMHQLVPHEEAEVLALSCHPPLTAFELKEVVKAAGERGWEGIVWHHPDGRMAKLKVRDLP